jgi:hypothetical protein
MDGKYSQVSEKARKVIINNCYSFFTSTEATLNMIFNKSSSLREMWEQKISNDKYISLGNSEVWPIINKDEILSKEIYKKYSQVTNYKKGEFN